MSKYTVNTAEYGTHRLIASEIGIGKSVLDVGCNKGYLKKLAPKNYFYGIDSDRIDLKEAMKNGYQSVYHLDLNNYTSFKVKNKFDFLIFADILEHLLFPDKVLRFFVNGYLEKEGKIIISLPNVAHISIRYNLLKGSFIYTDSGILDRTHLHLYTLNSARELIDSSGLVIIQEKYSSNRLGRLIHHLPFSGTLLGFNLIFICRKKS